MRKRYRRFYKMLIPYLMLFYAVLLIVSGVVYRSFLETLIREVEKSQLSMTSSVQKSWNEQIEAFTRIAIEISKNSAFTPHELNGGGYNLYLADQELDKLMIGNSMLTDIMYYPMEKNDSNYICSTQGGGDYSFYFDSVFHIQGLSSNYLHDLMKVIDSPIILPIRAQKNGLGWQNYLLYIYPFKSGDITTGVVMFFMQEDPMQNQLTNVLSGNKGYVYIIDKSGTPVTGASQGMDARSSVTVLQYIQKHSPSTDIRHVTAGGKTYILTGITSKDNGWSYYIATDSRQFMEKVYSTRAIFNMALLLLAIVGSAGVFVIALRNYMPLHALVKSIHKSPLVASPEEFDELNCISQYISCLSDKTMNYEIRRILSDLMNGKPVDETAVCSRLETAGLLHFPSCQVISVLIEGAADGTQPAFDYSGFLEMMASQSGIPQAFSFEQANGDNYAVLLCHNEDPENPCIRKYVDSVAKILNHHGSYTIGIGSPVSSILEVKKSMRQATAAVSYRVIRGKNVVIDYCEIKTSRRKFAYPFEYEQKLTRAFKQAQEEQIRQAMDEIAAYIENSTSSPDEARSICIGMAYAVVHTLEEIRFNIDLVIDSQSSLYPKPYEPVSQFAARVCELGNRVCRYINTHKESRNGELARTAEEYIRAHFTESAFSLNAVADQCGVSASYLSRFFKEQFGETVTQLADHLRMQRAKELLSGSDLNLREIIAASGYGSETNFIRKFKKEEGITPIQFRESVRAGRQVMVKPRS